MPLPGWKSPGFPEIPAATDRISWRIPEVDRMSSEDRLFSGRSTELLLKQTQLRHVQEQGESISLCPVFEQVLDCWGFCFLEGGFVLD